MKNIKTSLVDGSMLLKMECGKGNLLSASDIAELRSTLLAAAENPDLKSVVITGEGHSFSTGLKDIAEKTVSNKEQADSLFRSLDELLITLFDFPKPLIAAVNGHSVGAGMLIQLCADYVFLVESDRAKLGLPEFSLGFTLDEVMVELVKYSIPSSREVEKVLYSGELFGIARALELGLVSQIVPPEQLLDAAMTKANALAGNRSKAFASLKRSLRSSASASMKAAIANESHLAFAGLLEFN